eukprot:gnl/TRDRNA2_/TRDRNA2_123495_c0_seq1.p1 gnl/TRDRNA2_/TRDRNA2_123495_c0~~gnl/TRDRNA2_/TRDRNA2_123495_c0_seq1.p1  ORF type:complete len:400 (-),score=65.46 gnl/TRDRNA2_/TRDRNA2_123495_c0_seq1:56-1123(-)
MAHDPGGVLNSAVGACLGGRLSEGAPASAEASQALATCLLAARPMLETVHAAQARGVLGIAPGRSGCPTGSIIAWLDQMEPANVFPLCVRSEASLLDDDIRQFGAWKTCRDLAKLLRVIGSPGCQVLDIGANIGACTVMLAQLGYHITAFEPLPRNAELLEASLRLNGIGPPSTESAKSNAAMGTVKLERYALRDSPGVNHVVEGRSNAGMTIVVPQKPAQNCDENVFLCRRSRPVKAARLDDVWGPERGPVCLAKVDVEGGELSVLRGALSLLRSRAVAALHIEWWPPHLTALGEEPAALLWLLQALKYEIFAPGWWLQPDISKDDPRWLMVVPEQFPVLMQHWGDIVARAAPW